MLNLNFDLFQIGIFAMIQEIITYLLEVPSGILADKYGKKNILMTCFVFYCISFIFYFIGLSPTNPNFLEIVIASIFFGLGEAFRSGTHKAMEVQWMEKNGYLSYKTFIYGRTRSYSLMGQALSGILSVMFIGIIQIPPDRNIFLFTIIPYIIDFILISTYPSYMNKKYAKSKKMFSEFISGFKDLKIIFTKKLGKGIFSSSTYNSVFKTIKNYIQPIMKFYFIGVVALIVSNPTETENDYYISIILGFTYTTIYLLSSFASKNAYKFRDKVRNTKFAMDLLYDLFSLMMFLNAILIWFNVPELIIVMYILIYFTYNLRRPIVVDYIATMAPKDQQASILSTDSFLKSIMTFIFAPLFGFIAEKTSIPVLFVGISVFLFLLNRILADYKLRNKENEPEHLSKSVKLVSKTD